MKQRPATEARVCARCGYETFNDVRRCARCGGLVMSARAMRIFGWALVCIGSALVLSVGTIAFYAARIIYHSHDPGAREGFTGGPGIALFMFALFGMLILFGAACIASGAWQVRYGRTNRKLVFFILGLGLFFLIAGRIVRLFLH